MLVYLLFFSVALIVYLIKYIFNYWYRIGFPQDEKTVIPVGCLGPVLKQQESPGKCITHVYERTKGDYIGVYMFFRPALLIRNVDIARDMLMKSFANFHDRGVYDGGKHDPLNSNLFSQCGKEWVTMRKKLSPSFTTGKIKAMFLTSNDIANKMVEYMNTQIPEHGVIELDMKIFFTTYAIDIIASTVFGMEVNGFKNKKNKFRDIVENVRANNPKNILNTTVSFLLPRWYPLIQKLGLEVRTLYDLKDLMKEVVEVRQKNGVVRKDILQLLLQLQANDEINADDDNWDIKSNANRNIDHISLDNITAQSFIFYIAGQDTTASTASYTLAELAMHPEIMNKVKQEIDEVMAKHGGQFTYEVLQDLEYLDLCIRETLRKYPGLPNLSRVCTQDYQIPGTEKIIKKGTFILIPILGFHNDPEHFPNPEAYIPERFSGETSKAFLPFGEGPRICIAARFGKVNAKLAVAQVLYAFDIEPIAKRKYEIEPQSVTLLPKGGVKLKLCKRQKK